MSFRSVILVVGIFVLLVSPVTAASVDQVMMDWKIHFDQRNAEFEQENIGLKPIVFVGDSLTEGFDLNKFFPDWNTLNRGIISDTAGLKGKPGRGLLYRLDNSVFDCNPACVLLMIGVNDIGDMVRDWAPDPDGYNKMDPPSFKEITAGYQEVLKKIKKEMPDLPVYLQSCLPAGEKYARLNPHIDDFNEEIISMAEKFGYEFIDLRPLVTDDKGLLKSAYTRDGLHVIDDAYKLWADKVKEVLENDPKLTEYFKYAKKAGAEGEAEEEEKWPAWRVHHEKRLAQFREQNARLKAEMPDRKNIVFIGDSITEGFRLENYFSRYPVLNRGISSDRMGIPTWPEHGVLNRMGPTVLDCNPNCVFFMIGANDVGTLSRARKRQIENYGGAIMIEEVAAMEASMRKILAQIKENFPDIPVYVQSVLPTRDKYAFLNPEIKITNEWYRKVVADFGYEFVDLVPLFSDEEGLLKKEFSRDGIHITQDGYKVWADKIMPYIVKLYE